MNCISIFYSNININII